MISFVLRAIYNGIGYLLIYSIFHYIFDIQSLYSIIISTFLNTTFSELYIERIIKERESMMCRAVDMSIDDQIGILRDEIRDEITENSDRLNEEIDEGIRNIYERINMLEEKIFDNESYIDVDRI